MGVVEFLLRNIIRAVDPYAYQYYCVVYIVLLQESKHILYRMNECHVCNIFMLRGCWYLVSTYYSKKTWREIETAYMLDCFLFHYYIMYLQFLTFIER